MSSTPSDNDDELPVSPPVPASLHKVEDHGSHTTPVLFKPIITENHDEPTSPAISKTTNAQQEPLQHPTPPPSLTDEQQIERGDRFQGDSDPDKGYSDDYQRHGNGDIEHDVRDRDCLSLLRSCWYFLSVLALLVASAHIIAAGVYVEVNIGREWRGGLNVEGGWRWGLGLGLAAAVVGSWIVLSLVLGWLVVKRKGGSAFVCTWVLMCVITLLVSVLLAIFCLAIGFGWRREGLRDAAREGWRKDMGNPVDACQFERDFECRGFYPNDCFPTVSVTGSMFEGGGPALCPSCRASSAQATGSRQFVLKQGCFGALTRFLKLWYLVIGFMAIAVILLLIPYLIVTVMMLGLR